MIAIISTRRVFKGIAENRFGFVLTDADNKFHVGKHEIANIRSVNDARGCDIDMVVILADYRDGWQYAEVTEFLRQTRANIVELDALVKYIEHSKETLYDYKFLGLSW